MSDAEQSEALAKAWDEGFAAGEEAQIEAYWHGATEAQPNPYREETPK